MTMIFGMVHSAFLPHEPLVYESIDAENIWNNWRDTFNKSYDSREFYARRYIFKQNLKYIMDQNLCYHNGSCSYSLDLNQFADLTQTEWRYQYLGFSSFDNFGKDYVSESDSQTLHLPKTDVNSIDWRTKNAVTNVKNQGQCGSCWSFSSTGSMEGVWAIAKGELVSLSEQQLVDCSTSYGNNGCNGGMMDDAFKYVIDNGGLDTESDYPYTAQNGNCKVNKENIHVITISNYHNVPVNDEEQLKSAVAQQPVSVAIEADQTAFQFYSSGVFTAKCGTNLDHGVLVVGYGTDSNNQAYWIVKNSWGESWGQDGYILLERNVSEPEGKCGIAMQPSYPVV